MAADESTCDSKRIDLHTHILPSSLPNFSEKFGYGGWVSVEPIDKVSPRESLCAKRARIFILDRVTSNGFPGTL